MTETRDSHLFILFNELPLKENLRMTETLNVKLRKDEKNFL